MLEKLYLLTAEGYNPSIAQGPDDLVLARPSFAANDTVTLRVVASSTNSEQVNQWIVDKLDEWLELLPSNDHLLVRTVGWRSLWADGYIRLSQPEFVPFLRSKLVHACRSDPIGSTWWLETIAYEEKHKEAEPYYFSFFEHESGWSPLLVGCRHRIDECMNTIASMYEHMSIIEGNLNKESFR